MALQAPKLDDQVGLKHGIEARVLLHVACAICRAQLARCCHFLHEHPAGARSWAGEEVGALSRAPRVGPVVGHQCRYGQWAYGD